MMTDASLLGLPGSDPSNCEHKKLSPEQGYELVYSGATYEWPWLKDTDLGHSKLHLPMQKSLHDVFMVTEQW